MDKHTNAVAPIYDVDRPPVSKSSRRPATAVGREYARRMRHMQTIAEATEHTTYLRNMLIPDLYASGSHCTAEDFDLCCEYIDALISIINEEPST